MNKFKEFAKVINPLIKEKYNISLNFKGFDDFFEKYSYCNEQDMKTIYELILESSMWFNYISEIKNIINLYLEEILIEKDLNINDEEKMKEIIEKIKITKIFVSILDNKIKFFDKIFFSLLSQQTRNVKNNNKF